jgi:hypothetical protein
MFMMFSYAASVLWKSTSFAGAKEHIWLFCAKQRSINSG